MGTKARTVEVRQEARDGVDRDHEEDANDVPLLSLDEQRVSFSQAGIDAPNARGCRRTRGVC